MGLKISRASFFDSDPDKLCGEGSVSLLRGSDSAGRRFDEGAIVNLYP